MYLLFLLVHRRHYVDIAVQQLRRTGVIADALIQYGDAGHFVLCQRKVEEIKIIFDMRGVFGTGDHDVTSLNVPAQDNLGAAFVVFMGQPGKNRLLQQRLVPVAQGVPGLDHHPFRGQEIFQLLLLVVGVDLRLEK